MKDNLIYCDNILKKYKDGKNNITVIKPCSFGIKMNSINVILGESGSGKTTLISMLETIEKPTSGKIFYAGKEVYKLSLDDRAKLRGKNFGIMFQEFNLIDELSVKDNILLPLIINSLEYDKKYYNELIYKLGISKLQKKYPMEISRGQQQRVAMARAMIIKPEILFADEPTGNLDKKNAKILVDLLVDINNIYGTTLVVVTHNENLIDNPTKVIILDDGFITEKK